MFLCHIVTIWTSICSNHSTNSLDGYLKSRCSMKIISDETYIQFEVTWKSISFCYGTSKSNDISGAIIDWMVVVWVWLFKLIDRSEDGRISSINKLRTQMKMEEQPPRRGKCFSSQPFFMAITFKYVDALNQTGSNRPTVICIFPGLRNIEPSMLAYILITI